MLSVMSFEVGTSYNAQSVPYMEGNALCCCKDPANLCSHMYVNTSDGNPLNATKSVASWLPSFHVPFLLVEKAATCTCLLVCGSYRSFPELHIVQ